MKAIVFNSLLMSVLNFKKIHKIAFVILLQYNDVSTDYKAYIKTTITSKSV